MRVINNPSDMRAWAFAQRAEGKTIGFVPTMGALHEGHASLIRRAVRDNDLTVVSIFVNPTQFGPAEDFEKYPRPIEADSALCKSLGVDVIYAPDAEAMYPPGYVTYVEVECLTERLCGAARPGHFRGVTTVVTKLLNAVLPHRAYFGQKDAQQLAVIRRMARDLDLGVEVVEMPIVRESDGLAMSSRNKYLSAEERKRALCISRALFRAKEMLERGECDPQTLVTAVRDGLDAVDKVDYVDLVDAEDIQPLKRITGTVLLAVAAYVGKTRLIDNIKFEVPES